MPLLHYVRTSSARKTQRKHGDSRIEILRGNLISHFIPKRSAKVMKLRCYESKVYDENRVQCKSVEKTSGIPFSEVSVSNSAALDLVCFTVIVDDIVLHDGQTQMEVLGGGGPQTSYGYQLVASKLLGRCGKVGLLAGVGRDVPGSVLKWLEDMGVDNGGLLIKEHQLTPRAWQLYEEDGRRTQVWRVPTSEQLYAMLRPPLYEFPDSYMHPGVYHLGINPEHFDLEYLQGLQDNLHTRRVGATPELPRLGVLSVETFVHATSPVPTSKLTDLCQVADIVSFNEIEAMSLVGAGTPEQVVQRLADVGARMVLLRLGARGSMVFRSDTCEMWQVPAVPEVLPVDPTGCGNAFCGGFLAAWASGATFVEAGVWGSVAASFMLEAPGIPDTNLEGDVSARAALGYAHGPARHQ